MIVNDSIKVSEKYNCVVCDYNTYNKYDRKATLLNFMRLNSSHDCSKSQRNLATPRTITSPPRPAKKESMFCSASLSSAKANNHKENINITINTTNRK